MLGFGIGIPRMNKSGTRSLSFDGSNDYITIADNDALSFTGGSEGGTGAGSPDDEPFSIAFWIKRGLAPGGGFGNDGVITKGLTTGSGLLEWRIFFIGINIYMDRHDGSTGSAVNRFRRVIAGNASTDWQHIAFTYSGTVSDAVKVYVNGTAVSATASGTDADGMENEAGDVIVGLSGGYYLTGELSNMIVWKDYELDSTEAAYFAAASSNGHRNPLQSTDDYSGHTKVSLWLPFQSDLNDDSGNGLNAVANGGAGTVPTFVTTTPF